MVSYTDGKVRLLVEATVPANGYAVYDVRLHFDDHHICSLEARSVIEHYGNPLDTSIKLACHTSHRMSQDTGELFQREKFIVPRKFIGTGNAGTSQIIVELVEYEALPRLRQALARIFGNPQKGSSHRSTFMEPAATLHRLL